MKVRVATKSDVGNICRLMDQLGYSVDSCTISEKLRLIENADIDSVFVAETGGEVVGLISCHITTLFHQKGSSGRITSLIIDENQRGRGIGNLLCLRAERFFQSFDCVKSEVTSGNRRSDAHEFYRSMGYQIDGLRFIKMYG